MYLAGLCVFQYHVGLLNFGAKKRSLSDSSAHWIRQDSWQKHSVILRSLLQVTTTLEPNLELEEVEFNATINGTLHGNGTEEEGEGGDPMFPPDLFTMDQIKSGAVIFYIWGK